MSSGKGLHRAYQAAGTGFLAYKLGKLFVKIETPEDIALHNDILSDVLKMVGGSEDQFMKQIADDLLNRNKAGRCMHCGGKMKRKFRAKQFLRNVANRIIMIGMRKK